MRIRMRINEDIITKTDADGNTIIVNISKDDNKYYKLRGPSKVVWEFIKDGKEFSEIEKECLNRFNVSKEEFKADYDRFIEKALKLEFITK